MLPMKDATFIARLQQAGLFGNGDAKQKHLGCKKSARPIRSHNGYISDQKL